MLFGVWIQWFRRIIANSLDDPQAFCSAFAEQYAIAHSKVFWSLHESERDNRPVASPNESPVDVDYGTSLRYRANVKHSLVLGLDGGGVAEDQN